MDHPHIARVLDAGTTDSGRPYFDMELVQGVPITRFCDDHQLSIRARIELLIPVCQAVQHAHQKGIIHRDLKPSNVLVAVYDGKPVAKVIAFGVVKAVGAKLTEQTLETEFGSIIGTLEYMSPEQAGFDQFDVDTRSDIFSLGVILYELLTGATPLGRQRPAQASLLELLRIIREEEPPRPSAAGASAAIAAGRGLPPKKRGLLLRGELDWIVAKATRRRTATGALRNGERARPGPCAAASDDEGRFRRARRRPGIGSGSSRGGTGPRARPWCSSPWRS